jgi:Rps23 Pro-64 3,4-dihydroxylase Tpa1-like proline 4-hydroxylase
MKRARDARAKRAKEEKNAKKEAAKAAQGSPLNEDLFSPSKMAELKASYGASAPFPHLVVPNLCSAERARLIEVEARTGLKADFKETDLFKVYQTPDLGNLGLGAALADDVDPEYRSGFEVGGTTAAAAHWDAPQLMALRDALYSERFRDWVSELSGCGKLEPKADCSCNAYVEGGHLLFHDDVINTRRVSYIIYLNDPEQPWEACDGGALELYPLNPQLGIGHPDTIPVKNVLPNFNQMFLFTVRFYIRVVSSP